MLGVVCLHVVATVIINSFNYGIKRLLSTQYNADFKSLHFS